MLRLKINLHRFKLIFVTLRALRKITENWLPVIFSKEDWSEVTFTQEVRENTIFVRVKYTNL